MTRRKRGRERKEWGTHGSETVIVRSLAATPDGGGAPVVGVEGVEHDGHCWSREEYGI